MIIEVHRLDGERFLVNMQHVLRVEQIEDKTVNAPCRVFSNTGCFKDREITVTESMNDVLYKLRTEP